MRRDYTGARGARSASADVPAVSRAVVFGSTASVLAATYLYRFERFSRGVFIIDAVLMLLAILGSRLSFRVMAHAAAMQSTRAKRVLICGAGERGRLLAREMLANSGWHMKPVGFVDAAEISERSILGIRVLGRSATWPPFFGACRVDELVFSGDPIDAAQRQQAMQTCAESGTAVRELVFEIRDRAACPRRRGMTVAVLIVNWNSRGLLRECLEALAAQTRTPDRIILVDNNSTDDSLRAGRRLPAGRRGHPAAGKRRLCPRQQHRGEGRGRRRRARAPQSGRVSRARLARRARRARPNVSRMSHRSRAGCCLRLAAGFPRRRRRQLSLLRPRLAQRPSDARRAWPAADREVFAPCAAAALYRRAAFEAAGGFDEHYFCYFEDVDLGFRLRLAWLPLPVRARRGRQARELGVDRLPQRLRRLPRRAQRRLDVLQGHAVAPAAAVPAAAPCAQRCRAPVLPAARPRPRGVAREARRAARVAVRAGGGARRPAHARGQSVGSAPIVHARNRRGRAALLCCRVKAFLVQSQQSKVRSLRRHRILPREIVGDCPPIYRHTVQRPGQREKAARKEWREPGLEVCREPRGDDQAGTFKASHLDLTTERLGVGRIELHVPSAWLASVTMLGFSPPTPTPRSCMFMTKNRSWPADTSGSTSRFKADVVMPERIRGGNSEPGYPADADGNAGSCRKSLLQAQQAFRHQDGQQRE